MINNIAFIGGIHGVGKSSICKHICHALNMEHLTASELLKWEDINEDSKNKKVRNITETQERLILGLENTVNNSKCYLLDGHYCLLNSNNLIENVPFETFKQINLFSLNIILGDISEIKMRLETRDNKKYEYHLLEHLQHEELNYAKLLSEKLGLTLNIATQNDFSELLTSLRACMSSNQ